MMNNIRTEVLYLSAHLIITILLIIIYAVTLLTGKADATLQTVLTVVVGYWFGAMGVNALGVKKDNPTKDSKGE